MQSDDRGTSRSIRPTRIRESDGATLDDGEGLASFLKAALFVCFFAGTGLSCSVFLVRLQSRHLPEFLFTAALVLFVWFVAKKQVKGAWTRLFVLLLLCTGFFAGWTWFHNLGPERGELRPEGEALVERVEAFRVQAGRYPSSLEEAGCAPRWNRFGGWRYEAVKEGQDYVLHVGEYDMDGFVLSRDAERTWNLDG